MILRSFAERATRRLVLRRRLPEPFSSVRLFVSPEGGLRYLKPSLRTVDPVLLALVRAHVQAGHVVWDVGANVGLFAFAAAWAAGTDGRVVAFEPDTWLVDLLRRSARQAVGAPVDIVPVAASDTNGVALFDIARRSRASSHLKGFGTTQTGGTRQEQHVPTMTLDALCQYFPRPDVIKIDVEGAELLVLTGGKAMLAERQPVVICEVASANSESVARLLRDLDYEIYDGAASAEPITPTESPGHVTLAVPRGRLP